MKSKKSKVWIPKRFASPFEVLLGPPWRHPWGETLRRCRSPPTRSTNPCKSDWSGMVFAPFHRSIMVNAMTHGICDHKTNLGSATIVCVFCFCSMSCMNSGVRKNPRVCAPRLSLFCAVVPDYSRLRSHCDVLQLRSHFFINHFVAQLVQLFCSVRASEMIEWSTLTKAISL